jgi:hypothetical protein
MPKKGSLQRGKVELEFISFLQRLSQQTEIMYYSEWCISM